jgi:tetratricopeptide (TPR) repeat protein
MTTNIVSLPYVDHGDSEDLTASLQKVLELYPNHAPAHHDLGGAYYQGGDNENALAHYEKAVEIDPDNVIYQKSLADFDYSVAGRVEEALEIYFKVLDQQPQNLEVLQMVGHINVALQKFDDAEEYYKRVLEIDPLNQDASLLLDKLQNRHTSDAKPASAEEQYADIQTMINDGRQNDAVSALETLSESYPDFALAHNDLGVLYYNQGDKEIALNHYEQAVRLEPHNLNFQKNLADFYFVESGRIEDALAIYNKVLEADFGDVEALMSMGLICEALERPENARHFYNRVLENEPWNEDARQQLENL